jgi:hypothetical protein
MIRTQPAYLTFPPAAADLLTALYPANRLHLSAFLATAARHLGNHPYAPLDGCLTGHNCPPRVSAPPRRSGDAPATPLCALCALDVAIGRYANGMGESIQQEYWRIGTVGKQALIDMLEANPDAAPDKATERIAIDLSSRLHNGDLTPITAAEAAERADRFVCLRAITRTALGGRILASVTQSTVARLEARGWALGGYVTPQGRFAVEEQHRANLRAAKVRAGKA